MQLDQIKSLITVSKLGWKFLKHLLNIQYRRNYSSAKLSTSRHKSRDGKIRRLLFMEKQSFPHSLRNVLLIFRWHWKHVLLKAFLVKLAANLLLKSNTMKQNPETHRSSLFSTSNLQVVGGAINLVTSFLLHILNIYFILWIRLTPTSLDWID